MMKWFISTNKCNKRDFVYSNQERRKKERKKTPKMFGRQFHLVAIIICSRNISIWISVEQIFVAVVVVIRHRLIHNRHAVFVFYCCHTGILICLLLFLIRSSLSTIRYNVPFTFVFSLFRFFFHSFFRSFFSFVTAFLFPAWFWFLCFVSLKITFVLFHQQNTFQMTNAIMIIIVNFSMKLYIFHCSILSCCHLFVVCWMSNNGTALIAFPLSMANDNKPTTMTTTTTMAMT